MFTLMPTCLGEEKEGRRWEKRFAVFHRSNKFWETKPRAQNGDLLLTCDFIVPVWAKNQIDLQKTIQTVHNSVTGLEEAYTTVVAMIQI